MEKTSSNFFSYNSSQSSKQWNYPSKNLVGEYKEKYKKNQKYL